MLDLSLLSELILDVLYGSLFHPVGIEWNTNNMHAGWLFSIPKDHQQASVQAPALCQNIDSLRDLRTWSFRKQGTPHSIASLGKVGVDYLPSNQTEIDRPDTTSAQASSLACRCWTQLNQSQAGSTLL